MRVQWLSVAFTLMLCLTPLHVVSAPPSLSADGPTMLPAPVLLARGRTEPALALDPRNTRRLIVVANPDYYGLFAHEPRNGTFASSDGGITWTPGTAPTEGPFTSVADPSVAADVSGQFYYLYMGETPTFCGATGDTALLLARSSDGGRTFEPPTVVDINPLDDKPFLAVRAGAGLPTLFVAFSRWYAGQRRVYLTISHDGGLHFAAPVLLHTTTGVDFGATPLVGPHGRLYVLWAHYPRSSYDGPVAASIMLRTSADDGHSFGSVTTVAAYRGLPQLVMPGALRMFPLPTAAVDVRGTLYVAWVRARPMAAPPVAGAMEADLLLSATRNAGRTWTRPVVLNDTLRGDRFMPALAASGAGDVQVIFYDRRTDHLQFGLEAVAVHDSGAHLLVWPNLLISPTLSSPSWLHYIAPDSTCVAPGRFLGDYIAARTSADGTLNVAWADTALGHAQETDLWFRRVPAAALSAGIPRVLSW